MIHLEVIIKDNGDVEINGTNAGQMCFTSEAIASAVANYIDDSL